MHDYKIIDNAKTSDCWTLISSHTTHYIKELNLYAHNYTGNLVLIDISNAFKRGQVCQRVTLQAEGKHWHDSSAVYNALPSLGEDLREVMNKAVELCGDKNSADVPGHDVKIYISDEESKRTFSPFHLDRIKPLKEIPKKWTLPHVVRLLLNGQFTDLKCTGRYTDDYAHDAATNYGQDQIVSGEELAKDLLHSPGGWRAYTSGEKLHIACHHFLGYSLTVDLEGPRPTNDKDQAEEATQGQEEQTAEPTPKGRTLGREDYEDRQEARRDRYEELAAKNHKASDQAHEESRRIVEHIPMGQPILVGHHSEARHRRTLDRSWNKLGQAVALSDKASYYEGRAASVGTAGISTDNPDALALLREKLADLEQQRENNNRLNKAYRLFMKNPTKAQQQYDLTDAELNAFRAYVPKYSWDENYFIAQYVNQNLAGNIKRNKERIAELEKLASQEAISATFDSFTVEEDDNRIKFKFDGIPPVEVREILKRNGWKWSKFNKAWQRQITGNAVATYKHIIDKIVAAMGEGTKV